MEGTSYSSSLIRTWVFNLSFFHARRGITRTECCSSTTTCPFPRSFPQAMRRRRFAPSPSRPCVEGDGHETSPSEPRRYLSILRAASPTSCYVLQECTANRGTPSDGAAVVGCTSSLGLVPKTPVQAAGGLDAGQSLTLPTASRSACWPAAVGLLIACLLGLLLLELHLHHSRYRIDVLPLVDNVDLETTGVFPAPPDLGATPSRQRM